MNILVCIKQVPDTTIIKIDPETNTLMREGVPAIVSPFDAYALEAAARIKDDNLGVLVLVLDAGSSFECISIEGADDGGIALTHQGCWSRDQF